MTGNRRELTGELADYFRNRFAGAAKPEPDGTDYLRGWAGIFAAAEQCGAAEVINRKLCPSWPVAFRAPETVHVELYDSFAGPIPVIYAGDAADFESLVTNIVHKGIPPLNLSQTGAAFISGRTVRFLILSAKPYSNVPAEELGLAEALWQEKSMLLRRSHECTHFFTKQEYGISNNILHDELMADLIGLYDAFGFYKAEWFLRFMGLLPGSGGRFVVYTDSLSPEAAQAAGEILAEAAASLERWTQTEQFRSMTNADRIRRMCELGIEGILRGI